MARQKSRTRKFVLTRLPKGDSSGLSLVNMKVTHEDRKLIQKLAKRYMKGNISAWLRAAGTNFKPPKSWYIV